MAIQTENQGLYPLFTAQYTSNVELLLQQQESLLRGKVREQGGLVGKMAAPVNQFGEVTMKAPKGRFSPLDHQQPDTVRPWVFPQPGEIPQLIDSYDLLETIVDPKSPYAMAAAAATGRAWDDAIIAAATGTRQIGADIGALTPDSFVTANFQVASTFGSGATATGLTVPKMIEAIRIFEHYHNNLVSDPPCIVIGSQQHSDLLNQVTVVSTEFNDRPVLVDGRVRRFLGMDVVISERLAWASNLRTVILWVRSGLMLGLWKDMENYIDYRPDLSSRPYQLLTQSMYGAVRLQAGKVLSILCSDTTGVDITP